MKKRPAYIQRDIDRWEVLQKLEAKPPIQRTRRPGPFVKCDEFSRPVLVGDDGIEHVELDFSERAQWMLAALTREFWDAYHERHAIRTWGAFC